MTPTAANNVAHRTFELFTAVSFCYEPRPVAALLLILSAGFLPTVWLRGLLAGCAGGDERAARREVSGNLDLHLGFPQGAGHVVVLPSNLGQEVTVLIFVKHQLSIVVS